MAAISVIIRRVSGFLTPADVANLDFLANESLPWPVGFHSNVSVADRSRIVNNLVAQLVFMCGGEVNSLVQIDRPSLTILGKVIGLAAR